MSLSRGDSGFLSLHRFLVARSEIALYHKPANGWAKFVGHHFLFILCRCLGCLLCGSWAGWSEHKEEMTAISAQPLPSVGRLGCDANISHNQVRSFPGAAKDMVATTSASFFSLPFLEWPPLTSALSFISLSVAFIHLSCPNLLLLGRGLRRKILSLMVKECR